MLRLRTVVEAGASYLYSSEKESLICTTTDLIMVLRDGAVVEQGTHDELLRVGGLYSSMWQEQSLDGGAGDEMVTRLEDEVQEFPASRDEPLFTDVTEPTE